MPHPATVYAFGHVFTKSKNKAALKDPNPNYLQQRTLLTDLQTSNYLAYQIGVGVYCLFHSFHFCVNYRTKQILVVCETPHKGWQERMQINEWKSVAQTRCSFISLWSNMWTISAWVTNSSVIFNMLVSLCQKQKYQFFSETKQTHGVLTGNKSLGRFECDLWSRWWQSIIVMKWRIQGVQNY